jgi:hypothetical protein
MTTTRKYRTLSLPRFTFIALFLSALLIASFTAVRADSYYSSIGLGLPKYIVSTKANGMGGAGIGVMDRMALNSLNPATINIQGMTTLGVNLEYEIADNKSTVGSATTLYGNAMGMQFIVPVQKKVTLMAMIRPHTSSRYTLSYPNRDTSLEYTRTIKGDGGLSSGALGLQYQYKSRLSIAALADFYFGTFNEQWKYDFAKSEYRDGADEFNSHLWGLGYDLSAFLKVTKLISLGGVYRSTSKLNMETGITLANTLSIDADSNKIKIDYPAAYGLGVSFTLKKWLLAADFYTQRWNQYKNDGQKVAGLEAFTRYSLGAEYVDARSPLERYSRRIAWRLGGYFSQLPFTNAEGENVHEMFISAGIGLPFAVTVGQVDLAFEIGKRGDVERFMYEDTIFRLSASLTGGERWFQRRY